jgi:hypothetical protein
LFPADGIFPQLSRYYHHARPLATGISFMMDKISSDDRQISSIALKK